MDVTMSSGFETLAGILLVMLAAAPAVWTLWKRRLLARAAYRSARGHLKQGLTVALTASLATAVIAGALVVGDSMDAMVMTTATESLPGIDGTLRAVQPVETGYFTRLFIYPDWMDKVKKEALLLTVPAAVTCQRSGQRDGQVMLFGFSDTIYGMGSFYKNGDKRTANVGTGEVAINRYLADQAGVREGDRIALRVPNPSFGGDFLFLFGEDSSVESTFKVRSIFDNTGLGRLDLEAKRTPSSSVFMNMDDAQDLLDVGQKVNAAVFQYKNRDIVGTDRETRFLSRSEELLDIIVGAESIELVIQPSPRGWSVVTSERIFLQGHLEPALGATTFSWSPTLTYFVDRLAGPNGADLSYSTVSGLDFARDRKAFEDWRWNGSSPRTEPQSGTLQALVNNWTANQLGIDPGDTLTVDYTTVNDRYQLEKGSVDLVVVGIVDLAGKAYDPSLLPPIPGVHDAVSCLDWEAPFPMDLQTIEEEDVAYWNAYKGTPKVWMDLDTAKDLWSNPDGNWTSARYYPHGDTGNVSLDYFDDAVTASDAGISIHASRADALATSDPLAIFESMFLAFGAVLLLAGCLLEASAFANLARSRLREHATLRALGLDERGLIQVMLVEGTLWGGIAGIIGVIAGAGLGAGLVGALNTVWADAVEGTTIPLAIEGGSLWLALGLGLVVTLGTLFLSARKAARTTLSTALADRAGTAVDVSPPISRQRAILLALVLLIVPAVAGIFIRPSSDMGGMALFFIVGMLATLGGVLLAIPLLERIESRVKRGGLIAPWRMGLKSLNRRPRRALMLVATFALVAFAVIGISWAGEIEIRYAGDLQADQTGGYDVLAETWVQVGGDLKDDPNAPPGDWTVTPVRVVGHQGGTCSNLNARFPPRIMGLPDEFIENVTVGFRNSEVGGDRETWRSLTELTDDGHVPVVVDYNTLVWVYGGSIGDVYEVDGDRGRVFKMKVVAVMETSIFGGSFLTGIDMAMRVYPDSALYTYFLFDAGSAEPDKLAKELEEAYADLGLDARTTVEVVQENLAYELSFLRLFQAYLALGLIVGALGLGALAAREVQDRRREIGGMKALGWPKGKVWQTFLSEQIWIALTGVVVGIIGAAIAIVAVSPAWLGSVTAIYFPGGTIAILALAMVGAAALGALLAARDAARIDPSEAMRSMQ